MLAVIVPAHDEAQRIGRCLSSLQQAAAHPALAGETVMIIVVADDCSDDTESVARDAGAVAVSAGVRDAAIARGVGADLAVWAGARWLAFIDAHAIVDRDWLAAQLSAQADVVCGCTTFRDESVEPAGGVRVRAGNFGLNAATYCKSAGFTACIDDDDDLSLGRALAATGAVIVRSGAMTAIASGLSAYRPPVDVRTGPHVEPPSARAA